MTNKILFVHAGGSKTGTSALQNFFEINATQLQNRGFAYQNKVNIDFDNQINSGNGKLLYQVLMDDSVLDGDIDKMLLSYFGQCDKAICSSEYFASFKFDTCHWKKLIDSTRRLGIDLKIIFYVRNVIPFLQSAYDQGLKRHGQTKSFDEWVVKADWQHANALRKITKELPRSSIEVVHFDRVRSTLIRGFLDIVGFDVSFDVSENDQKRQVNRSLNEKERGALITLNKKFGSTFSAELSDMLIYSRPNLKGDPVFCSKKTADFLLTRFNKQVDWINETYFGNQNVVTVLPIGVEIASLSNEPERIPLKKNSLETILFNWAIKKLKTILEGDHPLSPNLLKRLIAAGRDIPKNRYPELPEDFDPLAYLLLNTDVLYAGIDPSMHYTQHGKKEGRPYKFKDKASD